MTGHTASIVYAFARLEQALRDAVEHPDADTRTRACAKVDRWRAVIDGMASGQLTVGSRTPVADTPAWVTLEVAHGGFATGRFLAEAELSEHEQALLASLPPAVPGTTSRERLNNGYLGDAGQAQLSAAVREGRYHVELPEDGALPVVISLLERGRELEALDLLTSLRPLMHRLRFYPKLESRPRAAGACVRLSTVAEVVRALEQTTTPTQILAMDEAAFVWAPLFDELVALWLETVEGEPPQLHWDSDRSNARVHGGWPCRRFPSDWAERRAEWLGEYRLTCEDHRLCGKHRHPKSNFSRLRVALERCPVDSSALDGRDVGQIRRTLANTITKIGVPHTPPRQQLRRAQVALASQPLHADLAKLLARRISAFPADGGLPSLAGFDDPSREGEHDSVPAGTAIPKSKLAKLPRALEAPIAELIQRRVIGSAEVLAIVLPQITAQVIAAGIDDPILRELFGQIYAAFRRRRSLLLLDLEHQVRLDELPWVSALAPFRHSDASSETAARQTLEEIAVTVLSAFPQTLTPNPLIRELRALSDKAKLDLPFVEEVAADIFMGVFTAKWADAAERAAKLLDGTLYARYYDLPKPGDPRLHEQFRKRSGKPTAERFSQLCAERAREAKFEPNRRSTAANGAILEQSQILTTQNLAVLVDGVGLTERLRPLASTLAANVFQWMVDHQIPPADQSPARLQFAKNLAYAWRQAIFWLSLADRDEQAAQIARVGELFRARPSPAWIPASEGLHNVFEGSRFNADGLDGRGGRRLLGWSNGPHWLLS